jgi:parallel beta-helix repeat protein
VSGNTVSYTGGDGMYVSGDTIKVMTNTVNNAGYRGIEIGGTTGNTVQSNVVNGAADSAIIVSSGTGTIAQNTARAAEAIGIYDLGTGNKIKGNIAVGNDTGISSSGTDGGGNKAAGNVSLDCTGTVVCTAP